MITLYIENYENEGLKTQKPLRLTIEDVEYVSDVSDVYGQVDLFEKLIPYIGYRIQVIHSGVRTDTKNYTIRNIDLNDTPTIDLVE